MSTNSAPERYKSFFSNSELTEILVKHNELHEGLYNLSIGFEVGFGAISPANQAVYPGAMIGISKIGIVQVDKKNIHTVDAAEVNPLPKE